MADVYLITDPTLTAFHEPRQPGETHEMIYYGATIDPETGDARMELNTTPAPGVSRALIIDTRELEHGKKEKE